MGDSMKAINLYQPWAELILLGRKTIELRTYRPSQFATFALRANQRVLRDQCTRFGLDPESMAADVLVGTVEVVGVIKFDQELWEATRDQHLSDAFGPGRWLGWRLENPRRLADPFPVDALPGVFNLPENITARLR
jgi:hypothetical protein